MVARELLNRPHHQKILPSGCTVVACETYFWPWPWTGWVISAQQVHVQEDKLRVSLVLLLFFVKWELPHRATVRTKMRYLKHADESSAQDVRCFQRQNGTCVSICVALRMLAERPVAALVCTLGYEGMEGWRSRETFQQGQGGLWSYRRKKEFGKYFWLLVLVLWRGDDKRKTTSLSAPTRNFPICPYFSEM